jgi:hypothetical protein
VKPKTFEQKALRLACLWGEGGVSFRPTQTNDESPYVTGLIEQLEKRWTLLNYRNSGRTLSLPTVQQQLSKVFTSSPVNPHFHPHPLANDLYGDMLSLRDEFEDVYINDDVRRHITRPYPIPNTNRRSISVVTQTVQLRSVNLGRFLITLPEPLGRVGLRPYDLWATPLEPNTVFNDGEGDESEYSHPHISAGGTGGGDLCYGDGTEHAGNCLRSGLIYDALLVASQVLYTYGSYNPYVDLSYWEDGDHSEPNSEPPDECYECAETNDLYYCDRCGTPVCPDHEHEFNSRTYCYPCYTTEKEAHEQKQKEQAAAEGTTEAA